MRNILIRIGILAAVFIVAVIGFSYLTNRENTDMTADIQGATLPYISFKTGDITVNQLVGYTARMDIPSMRDTITPVSNYKVRMNIHDSGTEVKLCKYEVYSLDGQEVLYRDAIEYPEAENTLQFDQENLLGSEKVLVVTLRMEDDVEVYYYTRIVDSEPMNVGVNLSYIQSFFNAEHDKTAFDEFKNKMEPDSSADNTTFQTVTIKSNFDNISWGELKPTVIGKPDWNIKEVNSTYTSVELNYRVTCKGEENEFDTYNINECFMVRYGGSSVYLLDYHRTMNQIFEGSANVVDEKGILLGIAPHNVQYMTDDDGSMVSFVQERELWSYNKKEGEISLVFSFDGQENNDIRYHYDQHEITLISVDNNGSTTFAVTGYMNRGAHEGQTGAAIYYFDSEKNAVEEKVFIPSDKSYSVIKNKGERMIYYSDDNQLLHILQNGTLYEINTEKDTREVLVEDMAEGQYVSSSDGHIFAYQVGGSVEDSQKIAVLNLSTGKNYEVNADDGESILPLGFVNEDFVYGVSKKDDTGTTISGETVIPMYKLEITDNKKNIVKTYQVENVYLLDIFVNDGLITLNRAARDGSVYTSIDSDYISSNKNKTNSNIYLKSYTTELKKTQMRLAYQDGIDNQNVKLLQPKQVVFKSTESLKLEDVETSGKYYVFAHGELQDVYSKASYAVKRAAELSGVAVTSNQAYVWERRGRDDNYLNENVGAFMVGEGESSLAACLRKIIEYEGGSIDTAAKLDEGKSPMDILDEFSGGEALDLTGCTVDEALYAVGRGRPVIAITGDNQAVLLVGYSSKTVTYIDPSSGAQTAVTTEVLGAMVSAGGNTFIAYTKISE